MTAYARNTQLAAYRSLSVQGAVDTADPHRLVQMLFDAILERLTKASACIARGEVVQRTQFLHSCVVLVSELRGSLNMTDGGQLALNLNNLYEYIIRRLLLANLNGNAEILVEVASLIGEIRSAWVAIGPQVRGTAAQPGAVGQPGAPAIATENTPHTNLAAQVR